MSFRTAAILATRVSRQPLASKLVAARTPAAAQRAFHATPAAFIKVGDPLPGLEDVLMENSPGNKVNLAQEAQALNKMILLGVPAAFSPACSAKHIPGFINHPRTKEFDLVAVVSVNDPFVMKAWGEVLDPAGDHNIRFLADPSGRFTKAMDMDFDGSSIFGNHRSKRYSILIENGKVTSVNVEPDNTGTSVSMAENVLGPA
ncbi:Redoxin-domain-containing protein [Lasiosphaeria miniovina]|uniref:Redoxin-domain-containing protein n=1 Tax=Lasiosphaeria miniovina TaxID=1954250 RepID=A0AA40DR66_9PEZI|nr:Redoxin-domain-containing protein [Lasiosphaeria miniovina]KAK0713134.1 Redoxin-domain-containing protein [Lasiosphaeria miniovina]